MSVRMQLALYPESIPQISASSGDAAAWKGDLLAIGIFEESLSDKAGVVMALHACEQHSVTNASVVGLSSQHERIAGDGGPFQDAELAALDGQLEGILTELIEKAEFKGKQVCRSSTRTCVLSQNTRSGTSHCNLRHQSAPSNVLFGKCTCSMTSAAPSDMNVLTG